MSFKVIYANEVYGDLQKAVDFYNARKKGITTVHARLSPIRDTKRVTRETEDCRDAYLRPSVTSDRLSVVCCQLVPVTDNR